MLYWWNNHRYEADSFAEGKKSTISMRDVVVNEENTIEKGGGKLPAQTNAAAGRLLPHEEWRILQCLDLCPHRHL